MVRFQAESSEGKPIKWSGEEDEDDDEMQRNFGLNAWEAWNDVPDVETDM